MGWVLIHGHLKSVLGSTLPIECWWMVVEVHDPDGDRHHGLGSWSLSRADLSYLGGGQGAMAVWHADSNMAPMIPASCYLCPYVISSFLKKRKFIWLYQVLVKTCGILFPDQRLNPGPPGSMHWEHGILATGPPEKFL